MEASLQNIVSSLADGGAEDRETTYVALEQAAKSRAVALVAACIKPLADHVLCAPAAHIAAAEWQRAGLLLYELIKVDLIKVGAELLRKADAGDAAASDGSEPAPPASPLGLIWAAPDSVLGAMIAKEPSEWTRDDAIIASVNIALCAPVWSAGMTVLMDEAGGVDEIDWFMTDWVHPYAPALMNGAVREPGRYLPLALLCLELVREADAQEHPEGLIAGAWLGTCHMSQAQPMVGKAVFEAGILDDFQRVMQRWNPVERISQSNWVATAVLCAVKDVMEEAQNAGVNILQPVLDAGAVDIAISSLLAYQMMAGSSDDTSALAIQ